MYSLHGRLTFLVTLYIGAKSGRCSGRTPAVFDSYDNVETELVSNTHSIQFYFQTILTSSNNGRPDTAL